MPISKEATTSSRTVSDCRMCGSANLHRYLDMGKTPLANSYISRAVSEVPEFVEELVLQYCRDCGLSQLTKVVPPDLMFRNYLYVSGTTATIRRHFGEFARTLREVAGAPAGALALDIASNDGTLLEAFKNCGLRPIGVDPAENLAREANARGLETLCDYWSLPLAEQILSTHGAPEIITAANVFAHADDLRSFCDAVRACLAPTGIFAIECPYVLDFLKRYEFDTAYHEHLSYIGLLPLARLLSRSGLELFDVEYFPDIHGGSIRAISAPTGARRPTARLRAAMEAERSFGLFDAAVYDEFGRKVLENKRRLRETVASLRGDGRTIWAYGASAKGNTLMNFFGLGSDQVPRVIDDNPKKWGLLTPGSRMEIVPIDSLVSNEVDFLILLAWNFEKEIRARCRKIGYRGRFLIPVPEVRIAETD